MIKWRTINGENSPRPEGGYSQAVEVQNVTRTLYISGQIPLSCDSRVPQSFEDQAMLVWNNIDAQLLASDMSLDNIVKVTIFLSDRRYNLENRRIRAAFLGDRSPALSVIITGIFDTSWLLEIEAIACA